MNRGRPPRFQLSGGFEGRVVLALGVWGTRGISTKSMRDTVQSIKVNLSEMRTLTVLRFPQGQLQR